MMKLNLFQIDAFTDKVFGGNPACVVPSDNWLPEDLPYLKFCSTIEHFLIEPGFVACC